MEGCFEFVLWASKYNNNNNLFSVVWQFEGLEKDTVHISWLTLWLWKRTWNIMEVVCVHVICRELKFGGQSKQEF